ncbi:hypothetical protein D3C77_706520 [compost metagenome]
MSAVFSVCQLSSQNFRRKALGPTANASGSRTITPSNTRRLPKSTRNWLAVDMDMMPASRRPLDRAWPTGALPPENSFMVALGSIFLPASA